MKILIIGQAPAAVKQQFPYDTTMLYDMFSWVGITNEQAQEMFEFEAVCGVFPGFGTKGHMIPTHAQMTEHWNSTLQMKVMIAEKIILLGNTAKDFFTYKTVLYDPKPNCIKIIHPSRRNYSRIMEQKEEITNSLKQFLNL